MKLRIRALLDACYLDAVHEGRDVGGTSIPPRRWTPTEADLDYVVAELGRRPTRDEWRAAGLSWVGSDHCAEGDR